MLKLPPYAKSIDQSRRPVYIWAGEKTRVFQSVRRFGANTIAFYPPHDPAEYVWFTKGRDVVLVHFFEAGNFWARQIVLANLEAGAARVAEVSWPHCGAWWNPIHDLICQFYGKDHGININLYSGS